MQLNTLLITAEIEEMVTWLLYMCSFYLGRPWAHEYEWQELMLWSQTRANGKRELFSVKEVQGEKETKPRPVCWGEHYVRKLFISDHFFFKLRTTWGAKLHPGLLQSTTTFSCIPVHTYFYVVAISEYYFIFCCFSMNVVFEMCWSYS